LATNIETLGAIFDLSDVAVAVTDMSGEVCYANPAFERLTGYAAEDLVGNSIELLGDFDLAELDAFWSTVRRGRSWEATYPIRKKGGNELLITVAINPVSEPGGTPELLVGIARPAARGRETPAATLTRRELDVLELMAKGLSNRAIADELGLSHRTVGHHVSRVHRKVDAPNRLVAAMRAGRPRRD